jgi:hypothetical protein
MTASGLPVTDLLTAPGTADVATPVGVDGWTRLRERLTDGVSDAATGLVGGGGLEVGLRQLRLARYRPESLDVPEEPFAWKPVFVRRSLGIAAVRACAEGRFRGPAEAVGPLADRAVEEWRRSGWRTFHWEPWFAGLGAGGRALVLAEAVTWATPMWAGLDWRLLGDSVELAPPDDRWSLPGGGRVRLRGRSEARVVRPDRTSAAPRSAALLSVSGGRPGDGWADELAFLGLVAGLASPAGPVPSRVVGMWPEAGVHLAVGLDEPTLAGAVDRVVDTVAVTTDVVGAAAPALA